MKKNYKQQPSITHLKKTFLEHCKAKPLPYIEIPLHLLMVKISSHFQKNVFPKIHCGNALVDTQGNNYLLLYYSI